MTGDGPHDIPVEAVDEIPDTESFTAKPPAETFADTYDSVAEAVASAVWHTIIDGAGHEEFVDDLSASTFRDAIHRLRGEGYANDALTSEDIHDPDPDDPPSGAAFFAGEGAAKIYERYSDNAARLDTPTSDAFDTRLPSVDGFTVNESPALPSNLIVFVDVDAIARIPAEGRNIPMGLDSAAAVSSPIVVRDEAGVVVINIAED